MVSRRSVVDLRGPGMANRLRLAQVHTTQVLNEQGWTQRRITRELEVHCDTVARFPRRGRAGPSRGAPGLPAKPAKVITGSDGCLEAEAAALVAGGTTARITNHAASVTACTETDMGIRTNSIVRPRLAGLFSCVPPGRVCRRCQSPSRSSAFGRGAFS